MADEFLEYRNAACFDIKVMSHMSLRHTLSIALPVEFNHFQSAKRCASGKWTPFMPAQIGRQIGHPLIYGCDGSLKNNLGKKTARGAETPRARHTLGKINSAGKSDIKILPRSIEHMAIKTG